MDLGWATLGSALLGAGTSLFGGNQQARAYQQAADQSAQFANRVWDETAGQRAGGQRMFSTYENAVNQPFQNTPGYQFARDEGLRSIDRGAAAQGLYGSGARARASARYTTGLADQTYQNWLAALRSGAGMGQAATSTAIGGAGGAMNAAGQFGANAGSAGGASIIGAGNAAQGGLNNLMLLRALGMN